MDRIHPLFTVSKSFSLLLLILLQTSTEAQMCSAGSPVNFKENNAVNDVVQTINVQPGVTVDFSPPPANPDNPFILVGNQLIAERVLDFETANFYEVGITCTETATGSKSTFVIVVLLTNTNDNPPIFDPTSYQIPVGELSPVGTSVGSFPAEDLDKHPHLFYTLTSTSEYFKLRSSNVPDILVNARLDYDRVKTVTLILTAQDTAILPEDEVFTATATITVTIFDEDNRPPWFQPCTQYEIVGNMICQSSGYSGMIVLNEQETGVLPLKPGPLYAIDGDSGINEEIAYSFLSGNEDGLFEINPKTGNITMLRPADVLGTISLTVMAAQTIQSYQFATTTVTISVQVESLHPPEFQKTLYEGFVTSVGSMVMDLMNKDQPLQILATDGDYIATGGLNPDITYSINGSSDFSLINGYLFMTKNLPEGILNLQVLAKDTIHDESAKSELSVEVKSGLTTTNLPLSTTNTMTTTSNEESTTDSKITNNNMSTTDPGMSTDGSISTTNPSTTSNGSISTAVPTMSTEGSFSTPVSPLTNEGMSTASTPQAVTSPAGGNDVLGMAVLGAVLGVLLFVCLVIIGVLVYHLRKGKADWRKIYEASMFRSSLGQGSGDHKEGIQYTNEAFRKDEDGSSLGSGGPEGGSVIARKESPQTSWNISREESIIRSSAALNDLLPDNTSDITSEKSDTDNDVKPILTKERRVEEGYKSVWFKEDIDPNAKEEVVIIPDSREDDSEEEDEQPSYSGREDDEDDNPSTKNIFADSDQHSGITVKTEDPQEDSDSDESVNLAL